MAKGPYTYQGRDEKNKLQKGTFDVEDLPAWVRERFGAGWKQLQVFQTTWGDVSLTCGGITLGKKTIHPESNSYRYWFADDSLGWRHSGQ